MRQRCLMARAGLRAPSVANVQALPDSSSHVIRCVRRWQRNTEFRRTRVIVYVCRCGGRRSGLSRILTSVTGRFCHHIIARPHCCRAPSPIRAWCPHGGHPPASSVCRVYADVAQHTSAASAEVRALTLPRPSRSRSPAPLLSFPPTASPSPSRPAVAATRLCAVGVTPRTSSPPGAACAVATSGAAWHTVTGAAQQMGPRDAAPASSRVLRGGALPSRWESSPQPRVARSAAGMHVAHARFGRSARL